MIAQCERITNWVSSYDTGQDLVTQAELTSSESDIDAACRRELEILLEVECLTAEVTVKHALNQIELEGKRRALDALTRVPAWEKDSLLSLLKSIDRDQLEMTNRLRLQIGGPRVEVG